MPVEDVINELKSLRFSLGGADSEVMRVMLRRWDVHDKSRSERELTEILFKLYDNALLEAISLLQKNL